jgi:class 3 adenylate cyclase/tetratricopeptide (TPR) repeat protein
MLEIRCPQCQATASPRAKFCSECGAKVEVGTPRKQVQAGSERRQVTILFADISGYTRLSSEIDPEELHGLLERYFEVVDGVVKDFGGTVDKHIGDAVMGVFGAPVSHGNDPERAVRAALAIHVAMRRLSTALGRTLFVHIGIASGEVVAGASGSDVHREYTVLGDAVNLASRLDGLAGAGETAISAGVERAVAGLVDAEPVGEVTVKGLGEAVRVYKVRGLREAQHDFRAPLVGRAAELGRFEQVLAGTEQRGTGAVFHLRGEPGVGKTRLVAEMRELAARARFTSHTGLVLDFGTARGQDAVGAIVRSALALSLDATPDERDAAITGGQGLSFEAEDSASLYDLLDLPQPPAIRGEYDSLSEAMRVAARGRAVSGIFERACHGTPQLVVVEDVHWADEATLGVISALAARSGTAPLLLVLTSRADGDPLGAAWRSRAGNATFVDIELAPLGAAAAEELAGHLGAPDSRRLRACVERSGGNPLFLEQLLASEAEGVLPDSVQSLVQARMDRLSPRDKGALQAAAVIGQRFSLDLLRHLLDDPDYGGEVLVERGLVRAAGDGWLFAHALVRDGAYSSLLKQTRRELHRRAGRWFGTTDPVLRAEHLDRAEDENAPAAYAAAALTRIEALDYDQAAALLARGAAIATRPADVFAIAYREGQLMLYRAEPKRALAAFERARAHAATSAEQCRSFIGIADSHRIIQDAGAGHQALERALELATPDGMDAERSQIARIRGSLRFTVGQDSLADQELALEHAVRAGSVELEARALSCLGDANYLLGRSRVAHDYFQRCVELSRRHGLGRVELYQHYMVGMTRFFTGDLRGALSAVEHGIQQAERAGHRRAEMIARETLSLILTQMGEYALALQQIDLGLPLADATGSNMFKAMMLSERAEALAASGDLAGARVAVDECLALNPAEGWWLVGSTVHSLKAYFAKSEAEVVQAFEEVKHLFDGIAPGVISVFFHVRAASVCFSRGYDSLAVEQANAALGQLEDAALLELDARRILSLVEYRRGSRAPELLARIGGLRAEALQMGFLTAVAAIDKELGTASA